MIQWSVDGRDSTGAETVLSLHVDGTDTGMRVSRDPSGIWVLSGGATLIDPPVLGRYIDRRRAMLEALHR